MIPLQKLICIGEAATGIQINTDMDCGVFNRCDTIDECSYVFDSELEINNAYQNGLNETTVKLFGMPTATSEVIMESVFDTVIGGLKNFFERLANLFRDLKNRIVGWFKKLFDKTNKVAKEDVKKAKEVVKDAKQVDGPEPGGDVTGGGGAIEGEKKEEPRGGALANRGEHGVSTEEDEKGLATKGGELANRRGGSSEGQKGLGAGQKSLGAGKQSIGDGGRKTFEMGLVTIHRIYADVNKIMKRLDDVTSIFISIKLAFADLLDSMKVYVDGMVRASQKESITTSDAQSLLSAYTRANGNKKDLENIGKEELNSIIMDGLELPGELSNAKDPKELETAVKNYILPGENAERRRMYITLSTLDDMAKFIEHSKQWLDNTTSAFNAIENSLRDASKEAGKLEGAFKKDASGKKGGAGLKFDDDVPEDIRKSVATSLQYMSLSARKTATTYADVTNHTSRNMLSAISMATGEYSRVIKHFASKAG